MAAVPADTSEPDGPLDMDYYLTEGLEHEEHQRYRDVSSFTSAIDLRAKELRSSNADEFPSTYLVFSHVTQQHLGTLQIVRNSHYKSLRFFYLRPLRALIVKMTIGESHESAIRAFEKVFDRKLVALGMGNILKSLGSTTFNGIDDQSRKEANAAFKPYSVRKNKGDWPSMVLECGVSQSPQRLKVDAHWWADNSVGDVKIVLLFIVSEKKRTIRLQYWKVEIVPNLNVTRSRPDPTIPRIAFENTIKIDSQGVTTIPKKGKEIAGGSLNLSCDRLFLRDPVEGVDEENVTFSTEDLKDFYDKTWQGFD
ncbi:hypothetical protein B9Z19DRAFT_1095905 [Tuber borchii]|uniref:Uncharacterized protein n=1 Tax=Tuber borchii TaxID=42251 RepID=A0A2T6ZC25_TUBBO|nr:hypothetical protein B9Z19DRAFT_1095905 [Tuber borchii]